MEAQRAGLAHEQVEVTAELAQAAERHLEVVPEAGATQQGVEVDEAQVATRAVETWHDSKDWHRTAQANGGL